MDMKMKSLVSAVLLSAVVLFSSTALKAQKAECCSKGDKGGCVMSLPDITDAQKQSLEKLKTQHQKDMISFKNLLAEKKAHLNTLSMAETADMAAINKTIDEIGALKTDMMKKCEAHKQDVRKVLTEKQRLIFDTQKHHGGHGMMKEGKGCKGEGMGNAGSGCKGSAEGMGQGPAGKCHGEGAK
jgi:Spy/CpxP family protein refolding chaperone